MYFLYIDESGDDNDYLDTDGRIIEGSSKFFTLGGVIVKEEYRHSFDNAINGIISDFFTGSPLPPNFKLHYHALRQKRYPFSMLTNNQRYEIANRIFRLIKENECSLLSATIDLENHCKKYTFPINCRAYTLYVMFERFQYFLQNNNDNGEAIFERLNNRLRRKVRKVHEWMRNYQSFPTPFTFDNISKDISNGNPSTQPILQIADFFAYAVWINRTTASAASSRLNEIKHKYYNLNHLFYLARGNIDI